MSLSEDWVHACIHACIMQASIINVSQHNMFKNVETTSILLRRSWIWIWIWSNGIFVEWKKIHMELKGCVLKTMRVVEMSRFMPKWEGTKNHAFTTIHAFILYSSSSPTFYSSNHYSIYTQFVIPSHSHESFWKRSRVTACNSTHSLSYLERYCWW